MNRPTLLPLLLLLANLAAAQTSTLNYGASAADFANPERGFYRYSETFASDYEPLSAATLASYRDLHTPPTANYPIYSTLVFRYFVLDSFKSAPVSQTFLNLMAADFDSARTAGVKLIVRFAYTIAAVPGACNAGWVCPPYGDAAEAWVITHIGQLSPVLQANKDVIAAVQMGFVGIWGENYYTDFFGDASVNGQGYLSPQNWADRGDVLSALLDAVPAGRMVQVRYPQMKQKFLFGTNAPTNSPPIAPAQAHNGSDIARIGFHNDCLLASDDDFGTFTNYDDPPSSDTATLKPYFATDSKYVAVGGETCFENNPADNCAANGGRADTEMKRLHYSYLNAQYNNAVNNGWTGTCMADIQKKLGYRFVLLSGTYPDEAQPGQSISVNISLKNEGYAAPFNPRGAELVLRNTATNLRWYAPLQDDPRFWLGHGAEHVISQSLCIPEVMPAGTYELLLNLPDPDTSIYARPEFAARLANTLPGGADVWESSTGYNSLGHSITVNQTAGGQACAGETAFGLASSYLSRCEPALSINNTAIPTGEYRSEGVLTSANSTVAADGIVLFFGETGVLLNAGFTVETGGVFQAVIEACPVGFAKGEAEEE